MTLDGYEIMKANSFVAWRSLLNDLIKIYSHFLFYTIFKKY